MADDTGIIDLVKIRDKSLRKAIKSASEEASDARGLTSGRLNTYTYAERPLNLGYADIAVITDGLDIGDTPSEGTGVLCMYKPAPLNEWYRIADNTVVAI